MPIIEQLQIQIPPTRLGVDRPREGLASGVVPGRIWGDRRPVVVLRYGVCDGRGHCRDLQRLHRPCGKVGDAGGRVAARGRDLVRDL